MNADFTLSLNESTANSVGFYRAGPTLIAGVFVDEADVGSGAVPFRIVEHRFLRIVIDELGQEVAFEHSADGGNWTEFYRKTTIPVALRRSKLSVAAVGTGVAGSLVLRDVRITRP